MAVRVQDLQGVVMVLDSHGADGAFILAHILKLGLGLDGDHRVLLVAARHTAPHYANVLRKNGLHMVQLMERGRLALVDALRMPPGVPPQLINLRNLEKRMMKGASALADDHRPLLVIIDDLTALHCAAEDVEEWPAFLHACAAIHAASERPGCTVALAHGDVVEDKSWLSRLEHAASLVVEVEALDMGQSAEISGRVAVCRREALLAAGLSEGGDSLGQLQLGSEEWHYKLAEGGVKFVRQKRS